MNFRDFFQNRKVKRPTVFVVADLEVNKRKKNSLTVTCPECNGSGEVVYNDYAGRTQPCDTCKGGGLVELRLKNKK